MSLDFYLHYEVDGNSISVFDRNITHNLGRMAGAAGIYEALWRPDEGGYTTAKEIILLLEKGLKKLLRSPAKYKKFDAENGWGLYEHFVPFVEEVLAACKQYPNAKINVSR
jgi:hypothetical protein